MTKLQLLLGTILNLINQGDALFSGGHLNLTKIILICVGTIGVGEQATGDLTAQMPRKVSAVHVIYLAVWMVADSQRR